MKNRITIGTVSHGTLRTEDLLEAFASELERVSDGEYESYIDDARVLFSLLESNDGRVPALATYADEWRSRSHVWSDDMELAASEIVSDLQNYLNEHAPAHTYFGAHEGDGADFGFWPTGDFDGCEQAFIHDRQGPNGDAEFVDLDCKLYVNVNDHGNITVQELGGAEIWSAV